MQGEYPYDLVYLQDLLCKMERGDKLYKAVRSALKTRGLWKDAKTRSDVEELSVKMTNIMNNTHYIPSHLNPRAIPKYDPGAFAEIPSQWDVPF